MSLDAKRGKTIAVYFYIYLSVKGNHAGVGQIYISDDALGTYASVRKKLSPIFSSISYLPLPLVPGAIGAVMVLTGFTTHAYSFKRLALPRLPQHLPLFA